MPDPLAGWNPAIPGDVAADIADAEAAVRRLDGAGVSHVSPDALARLLLRAESIASSRIEGLAVGTQRLVDAEVALSGGRNAVDPVADEVLGNADAMELAIALASRAQNFDLDNLLTIHGVLMQRSATPQVGGQLRTEQNWIGGSSYNPCSASFVPPPPDHVEELLDDLVAYVNRDDHSPLVQAALAHAQFETIHPFADGNGRTGRTLIHVVLRRRGLAPRLVPPISIALATWSATYVAGLMSFRHLGQPDRSERSAAAAEWLRIVATATHRSCIEAERYAEQINAMAAGWRQRLGRTRANSSTDLLLQVLPGVSIVNVESASALIGRSKARTTEGVNALAEAGILRQHNVGKQRYRVVEVTDVLSFFTDLDQVLGGSAHKGVPA